MNIYPNVLTPPSSNEDSPVYHNMDNNSMNFHAPDNYDALPVATFDILPQTPMKVDSSMMVDNPNNPSLHFVEQPTDRFRFRYKSEMAGTHGSLTGIKSDKSRKQTYPTVELRNFVGPVIIRCSIYQHNVKGEDFMPHAHRLIMKRGKEEHDDPHDLIVGPEDGWRATFHGMGIIHTAKKNIVSELMRKKKQLKMEYIARMEQRPRELTTAEKLEIKGLAEAESKSINLNIVCLRFDAFVKRNDILFPICAPIYSSGINNLKSALTGELRIVRLDHCTSPAKGNKEIFILVERVTKKNIKVRFFEQDEKGDEIWSEYGKFNDMDVHHQYAIVFKTPKYKDENIKDKVKVFIELVRPSDMARSEPREFTYVPSSIKPGSKRPRHDFSSSSYDSSSSYNSNDLPLDVSNLNIQNTLNVVTPNPVNNINFNNLVNNTVNSWDTNKLLSSEELMVAVNNIDSNELQRLFAQFGPEYASCLNSVVVDAPVAERKIGKVRVALAQTLMPRSAIKLEVSQEDKQMANRVYEELKSFVKINPKTHIAKKMLHHYLGADHRTNALHVFVSQNNPEAAAFFLKLLIMYQELQLINRRNSYCQTPLQLAVLCHNALLVEYLMRSTARVKETGDRGNTALHNAVEENASVKILETLLQDREYEKVSDFIDEVNNDGNTALMIAVENKNLSAVKMLCMKGANINQYSDKNGFTALRLAIEKQHLDILKYILSIPHLDPKILDFNDTSPLAAAFHRNCSKEITEVIEKYMADHNLEVDIKEEMEDDSDEEMEEDSDIKSEPLTPQELEELYKNVHSFTPACLDEVSALLNESGKWEDLAELLDVTSLLRCGLISPTPNVSKNLLTFAVETHNDTLWEIRNFLENLDELQAVEKIDRMVREQQ
ncbi:nuclear factor NF-kappa-B p110 subunit isoform X2 [Anoplophora glabripennis]|nr:nuclear factor NF-kappa-B p110 subunit isoform X2 [Anoplophora glabripennis]XP_018565826.1 nuclear factor NF-kappa-B p110 subunit isoform X2 [Anoplophora glabripennis]XP_018565827.1 nuclear factor NF-kappa-B p110 subunit isoform X2 [Anoplophora glabripennis]